MQLKDLPDYPALKQVADALWGCGDTNGAAVMVGAGFSRNAALPSPTSKKAPLWSDFLQTMVCKLYPDSDASEHSSDPLRLAEEYRAAYGTAALEGFIRKLVPDEQWEPGKLHKKLIDLPWTDVLTTNWDTLLERTAASSLKRNYEVILTAADIARTHSPRIVKLHGSLPSHTPFIFTEEDYRTYPVKFSPFVNLVKQVLLENDLCLMGFSGDDPNFIQWSGWVRDELGVSARRIFLIGRLNLTPTKRRYLEARHVTPIDLFPLFPNTDHEDPNAEATKCVLKFFYESRPKTSTNWPNEDLEKQLKEERLSTKKNGTPMPDFHKALKDPEFLAQRFREKIPLLKKLRTTYPGWIVCPHEHRSQVRWCLDAALRGLDQAFDLLKEEESAEILYEIAWAHDITCWPIPQYLYGQLAEVVNGRYSMSISIFQRCYIALILLRLARENGDDEKLSLWEDWLQKNKVEDQDFEAHLAYESCIRARDHLDFATMYDFLPKIKGTDPIWQLRRSSMYAELGEFESAESIIRQTHRELETKHAKDRGSIWLLSRLAWSTFLLHAIQTTGTEEDDEYSYASDVYERGHWPVIFKESKCDPWDELIHLDDSIAKSLDKQRVESRTIQPRFDAGHYSDSSNTVHFTSGTVVPTNYELRSILDNVGVPMSLGFVNLTNGRLVNSLALEQWDSANNFLRNIRILSKANKKTMDQFFGRISVAKIPTDIVSALVDPLNNSIKFGSKRFTAKSTSGNTEHYDTYWIDRLRNLIEILSRLVVRLPTKKAKSIFQEASAYAKNQEWSHWWLFEPLENLLRRSIEAMPPKERSKLTLEILNIPLACERKIDGIERDWPEVIESAELKLSKREPNDNNWDKRVSKLITIAAAKEDLSRHNAILRLTHLYSNNLLSAQEALSFANALWKQRDNKESLPKNTMLYAHVFMQLPEPSEGTAENVFRKIYFEQFNASSANSLSTLIAIRGAALLENKEPCRPTLQQATQILHLLLDIKLKSPAFPYFQDDDPKQAFLTIGAVLSDAVLPVFDSSTWQENESKQLLNWIESSENSSSLRVLPQLVRLDSSKASYAEEKLRRGLASREQAVLSSAIDGVIKWINMASESGISPFPESLTRAIVGIVVNRRHPLLHLSIYTAEILVKKNLLSKDEIVALMDSLEDLRHETNYADWDELHPETHCLSLIRSNCVRLSRALIKAGNTASQLDIWISESESDPVPEVRYAY